MERQNSALNGRLFNLLKKMEIENKQTFKIEQKSLEPKSDQQTELKKVNVLNDLFCFFLPKFIQPFNVLVVNCLKNP